MPRFTVQITETFREHNLPVASNEPTPNMRDVCWEGEALSDERAREAGYDAWDQKYGFGRQPASAIVRVTQLDA